MKEIIYLRISHGRIEGMTKSLPSHHRGEIIAKVEVVVDPGAFREPVIERKVHIEDWRQGIDLGDVQFSNPVITEDEAELIRARRLARMREVLEAQGFTVEPPAQDGTDG